MPMGVPIVRNSHGVSAIVRNSGKTRGGKGETTETQFQMNNADSQPQKKHKKEYSSSYVNPEYVNRIVDWLRNDEITTIGIYGMGGIGKTTLAMELHTRLVNKDIALIDTQATAWLTVEMDFTVFQLQKKIAAVFGLDLEGDRDDIRRAATLHSFLSRYDRCILFIDNMWGDFRREDVGIPKTCILIVISRLLDVCRRLHCQKIIKLEPLSEEESWLMFHHIIGGCVLASKQVSSIRERVYNESAGLPLSIAALADSMTVVDDATKRWEFNIGPTQFKGILNRLKLSYNRLNNIKLQCCFLCCVLYPRDHPISKEELISLWIQQRLIDDVPSLQAQYDMGHSILHKLINSCLLENCKDEESIKMHDLVRRMALFVAKDCSMVKVDILSKWGLHKYEVTTKID